MGWLSALANTLTNTLTRTAEAVKTAVAKVTVTGITKCTVAILALSILPSVSAHGYLAQPAARNVQRNSNYCPACLNAGGPWTMFARGRPARYGVCGDPWNGPKDHERGGKFARPVRIAGRYRAGQTFVARVVLTANHWGRWSLRLCTDPTKAVYGRSCAWRLLRRTDGKTHTTVTKGMRYAVRYRLPNVRCRNCVIQWVYETGNSCNPPGQRRPGLEPCNRSPNGELFINCADVTIT